MIDVNGDKKPTPSNVNCKDWNCAAKDNVYKVPLPAEKKVRDIFSILITEDRAIPYGVTAQKAMYQGSKINRIAKIQIKFILSLKSLINYQALFY